MWPAKIQKKSHFYKWKRDKISQVYNIYQILRINNVFESTNIFLYISSTSTKKVNSEFLDLKTHPIPVPVHNRLHQVRKIFTHCNKKSILKFKIFFEK